jgi:hypothetical protein
VLATGFPASPVRDRDGYGAPSIVPHPLCHAPGPPSAGGASSLCVRGLQGAERVPEQEPSDDLEYAHDDEPDPEQDGKDVE